MEFRRSIHFASSCFSFFLPSHSYARIYIFLLISVRIDSQETDERSLHTYYSIPDVPEVLNVHMNEIYNKKKLQLNEIN